MALTWQPPTIEEEKKKKTWTPPKPIVEEEEVVKATWQPPKPKPTIEPIDLSKYSPQGYDEPSWTDVAFHSTKAGFGDVQTMMLSLGKLLYEGGVQITDKVTDIFDKDLYDPKKDKLRAWIGDLVSKSETIAEDSWEKVISKNRLKNFVALGGRAVPLSLITLLSGGALVGAYPALAMKVGSLPAHMIPFGASAIGGHARRVEKEFEERGKEAPYLAQLFGGIVGAMGEVATEAIPFQRWLNVYGGSKVINRGAKTFLGKYGRLGIEWATGLVTETAQEVAMVPIEKAISNILHDEREPLFPIPEMIQAGTAGLAMSLILGGIGSTNSAIRTFTESKVDKMLKHDITIRDATLDIAEKVVEEADPEMKVEEYLPEEPKADESVEEQFVRKNIHKVVPRFPRSEWEVTDQSSLRRLGGAIADAVGLDKLDITWTLGKTRFGITGTHTETKFYGHYIKIKTSGPATSPYHVVLGRYQGPEGSLLGRQLRGPSHGTMVKVMLHELGHIASPPVVVPGRKRAIHTPEFHRWTMDNKGALWLETPLLSVEEIRFEKEVQKGEIEKARITDKYGLDPKDFKHTKLPKGEMEEEDISGVIKKLQDAGYGKEEDVSKEKVKGEVNEDKVNVHVMTKDEFVKKMMKKKGPVVSEDLKLLAGQAAKYESINEFVNSIPEYIQTKTGKLVENISDPTSWKDLTIKELIGLKNSNPNYVLSAKLVSGRRGGVSRQKITVNQLILPDNIVNFYDQSKLTISKTYAELDPGDQEFAEATFKAEQDELPATPTPEGVKLSGRMKLYMKILRGTLILDPSAKNVYDAIAEMEGTIAEAEYVAKQVHDTWERMVPNAKDEELIDKYCDMPEKYQAEITEKGLQNEADWIKKQYKSLGEVAKEAGAIGALWRNYAPFMFKNIHEWMKINPDAGIPVTGILGTKFAHGIERNLQNYEDAEAAGLIPEHRVGLKLNQYMFSLSKVIAHKNFVDLVREMTDENGHPVATPFDSREEWARDYRQVANPQFAKSVAVKQKNGTIKRVPLRWKPEVADAIEEIAVPSWMQSKPYRNIKMIRGIVKRLIFLNPAIHGWNIFSDVLDEVNFNFLEAINAIRPKGKGAEIYLTNTKLTREALKANLNLAHTGRLGRQIREEIYDLVPLEGKNVITKGIGKLFAWNDNVLWTTIVRNAQMYTYALKRKQGLTPKQSAAFTNDLLGTLPKRYFTNFEWGVASNFFLARNWTISNLRLLTGAIGPMSNIIPIKALTRKEMSPADMKALAPHYIRHLIKGMFGLFMLTNLLNKLFTGRWALENETGHKMDVYTGMKDNKGREIYIVMPLLRYMRDYLGWATQPRRTIWNKMEPMMKTSLELLINHSMWQNKKIMHPEAPLPEKIKDAAEYALWSWTPFDQFLDSENEVKTTLQKMMYFTGTWVRRGSSISAYSYNTLRAEEKVEFVQSLNSKEINELYGNLAIGRLYGDVAGKLYKFRSKKGYVKEKLDASIDKLLTGGDIPGAIELMIESGRYKEMSSVKDRIMPYLMLRK